MFAGCAHRYQLGMIKGWRPRENGIDVAFGSWVHLGIETFYRMVIENGMSHDDALKRACLAVIEASWRVEVDPNDPTCPPQEGPMFGQYLDAWHCLGDVKGYKNEKGNPAKCPYSHVGKFFDGHGPDRCGKCGGTIERVTRWVPESKAKDRYNALRAVAWYVDEMRDSHLKPVSIGSVPLVECHATVHGTDDEGRPFKFVMNFDAIKAFGDELFIADYKTTGMTMGKLYFSRFQPNMQADAYGALAPLARLRGFEEMALLEGISGVVIEGMQVLVSGVRFGAQLFRMPDAYKKEVQEDIVRDINLAWAYAEKLGPDVAWPRNRSACTLCPFKIVCAAAPEHREAILAEHFERRRWNPVTRTAEEIPG